MPKVPQIWQFMFSDVITSPPTGSQIRFNAGAPYSAVTKIWIRDITVNNRDISTLIQRIAPNTTIYIQDLDEATRFAVFRTTAAPVHIVNYTELSVQHIDSGIPFAVQQVDLQTAIVFGTDDLYVSGTGTPGTHAQWTGLLTLGNAPPAPAGITGTGTPGAHAQWTSATVLGDAPAEPPGITGSGHAGALAKWVTSTELGESVYIELPIAPGVPEGPAAPIEVPAGYVSLDIVKAHLRITDTAHDEDITAKMNQAEAIILDYVSSGRTRWEDPTLPAPETAGGMILQSAILEFACSLYEHRGDDYGTNATSVSTADAELWAAMVRKVGRLRDPALA